MEKYTTWLRKNIFMVLMIFGLVIGNGICYWYNERPLHTITNIVMVVLIYMNYGRRK